MLETFLFAYLLILIALALGLCVQAYRLRSWAAARDANADPSALIRLAQSEPTQEVRYETA